MRFVSEQFKELQGELVRPALRMYFEIDTAIANPLSRFTRLDFPELNLDKDYTPIVPPKDCTNERFYAILGDTVGVDDPNRICAPAIPNGEGTYKLPTDSVPYGVTPFCLRNHEAQIGSSTPSLDENYNDFSLPVTLSFKGGLIPEQVRVLYYDDDASDWIEETILYNPDLEEEITFTATDHFWSCRLFLPRNSTKAGRYQFNYFKQGFSSNYDVRLHSIVFEDSLISNISISEETDLTSQTLPQYEMTVECLDVEEQYTPDTDYWKEQFTDGTPCYLKVGYEINGTVEYIPLFYGILTKAPDYNAGKLTFSVAVDWTDTWIADFGSNVSRTLNTGDLVLDINFKDYLDENLRTFDSYDVFSNQDDIDNSVFNYYGETDLGGARQMIANALGGYITAGIDTVDLHSTNDIQYKDAVDNVTRFEQIQNTLESQPKVGKIVVTRNENRLSGTNTVQLTASEKIYIPAGESRSYQYKVPFYAVGKYVVNDYQKSVPSAVVGVDYGLMPETVDEDGTIICVIWFDSDTTTYIQPIVTFYGVDNQQFPETSYHNDGEGDLYENNNDLVTNSYISGKVKRVAHMISDVSNQYSVDVMQDLRYQLGDIIRLETQKDIFKTCIITGLNFNLPGSVGHLTCRKIFNIGDVSIAKTDVEGAVISFPDEGITLTILETNGKPVVVGRSYYEDTGDTTYVLLNVKRFKKEITGQAPSQNTQTLLVIDNNGNGWDMAYLTESVSEVETPLGYLELPNYNEDITPSFHGFAAISMVMAVYEDQGMTAPVDYGCEVRYMPVE